MYKSKGYFGDVDLLSNFDLTITTEAGLLPKMPDWMPLTPAHTHTASGTSCLVVKYPITC